MALPNLCWLTAFARLCYILSLAICNPPIASVAGIPDPRITADTLVIRKIIISGNSITRNSIILRELTFRAGDTMSSQQLSGSLVTSRQNIFNTRLFNFVTIDTTQKADRGNIDISISVVERWYIWPVPFLEFSDRNFNVWWESRELKRLTYGVDFSFFNSRGRKEILKIITHLGYNQQYGFAYTIPYLNHKQTLGVDFGASVELSHELPVMTRDNEPVYVGSGSDYLKKLFQGFAEMSYRPDLFSIHAFRVTYSWYDFDSAVLAVPGFSMKQQQVQQVAGFTYHFKNDRRDVHYYPLKGFCIEAELNHSVPYRVAYNTYVRMNFRLYRQIYDRWYWASGFTGKISFEKKQPYYLQRGLGYGWDIVRGYEYYVIDGQHFALLKNNLKFALLPTRVARIGFIPTEKFNTIPLSLYLNAFIDLGYVYKYADPGSGDAGQVNGLENNLLAGYGLGLDFATYYDFVIRIEGAMNLMGRPGIYIHFTAPI